MCEMISVQNLSKRYKDNILFEHAELIILKGEICGLVGRNGSGKSVLLKMICGLVLPDEGEIIVDGEEIANGCFSENIGVVLDCAGFLPKYTGFENLKMIAGIRKKITNSDIEETMRSVGLNPFLKTKVGQYSLGMKQRLALAQALMETPDLLILDEPLNGVDEESLTDIRELLKQLNKERNITMLIASHNKEDIEVLCDKVYEINNRQIISKIN